MRKSIVTAEDANGNELEILIHFEVETLNKAQVIFNETGYGDFKPIKIETINFYSEINERHV